MLENCAQRFVDGLFISTGTLTRKGELSFQMSVTCKMCALALHAALWYHCC